MVVSVAVLSVRKELNGLKVCKLSTTGKHYCEVGHAVFFSMGTFSELERESN